MGQFPSQAAGSRYPADIHRVVHDGSAPTVTLHVCSPRIARPGAYSVSAQGEAV